MAIAARVKTRIDLLTDTTDGSLHLAMPLCKKTLCKLARFGSGSNAMEIKDGKYITIESVEEGNFLVMLEKIRNDLPQGAKINISNITLSGDQRAINELQRLITNATHGQCTVKVDKILLERQFCEIPFELMHLAATLRTLSIQTTNVQFSMLHGSNKQIKEVNFDDDVALEDFYSFKRRFLWIPKLFVANLHMSTAINMQGILRSLIEILGGRRTCIVETLHSACGIGSILQHLRKYMDNENLRSISSDHHGGMNLTKEREKEFVLRMKRLRVTESDDMLKSFGNFQPNNIVIEEFVIGENQDATLQQLSGIPSPEMRSFLLQNAKAFSQQKLTKHLASMEKFCDKNHVSIIALHVNDNVINLEEVINHAKKLSISSVVAQNIQITFCDPDHRIKSVEVPCDLRSGLDEIVHIQRSLTPDTITTSDYVFQMRYLPDNAIAMYPHIRVGDRGEHHQAMLEFAGKISAQIRSSAVLDAAEGGNECHNELHGVCDPNRPSSIYELDCDLDTDYEDIDSPQETSPKEVFTWD